jgi:DNA transformation protein
MAVKRARAARRSPIQDLELSQGSPRDSMWEWLEERLDKLPELELHRLFGGAGVYAGGTMFGILHSGIIYLKTSEATRQAFVDRGMGPFRTPRGAVLKSYYEVPPDVLEDQDELLVWARRAVEVADVASTLRASRPRRRSK